MLPPGVERKGKGGGKLGMSGGSPSRVKNIYLVLNFASVMSCSPCSSTIWCLRGREVKGLCQKAAFPCPRRTYSPCWMACFSALLEPHLFAHLWDISYWYLLQFWRAFDEKDIGERKGTGRNSCGFVIEMNIIETTLRGLGPGSILLYERGQGAVTGSKAHLLALEFKWNTGILPSHPDPPCVSL